MINVEFTEEELVLLWDYFMPSKKEFCSGRHDVYNELYEKVKNAGELAGLDIEDKDAYSTDDYYRQ